MIPNRLQGRPRRVWGAPRAAVAEELCGGSVQKYRRALASRLAQLSGVVVGMMTAIRRCGRITGVRDRLLFDEFADLDQSYDSTDDEGELGRMSGHRLFKYNDESSVPSRMQYSVVADSVYSGDNETVTIFSGGINNRTNLSASAFYNLNTSDREPSGGWKIGDALR